MRADSANPIRVTGLKQLGSSCDHLTREPQLGAGKGRAQFCQLGAMVMRTRCGLLKEPLRRSFGLSARDLSLSMASGYDEDSPIRLDRRN